MPSGWRRSGSSSDRRPGRDGHPAAAGHRIARVEHEIDQHLLELAAVGADLARVGGQGQLQDVVLPQHAAQHPLQSCTTPFTGNTSGRRNCWRVKASSWRVTSAARVPALMISSTSARRGSLGLEAPEQELAEADHPGHHVVDFVGHATRQPPGGLHPLRPAELFLDPLPLGHVPIDAAEHAGRIGPGRAHVAVDGERHADGGHQDQLNMIDRFTLPNRRRRRVEIQAVGMDHVLEPQPGSSSSEKPTSSDHALLTYWNSPSTVVMQTRSLALSNRSRYRASLSRSAFSASFRSLTSRALRQTPMMVPSSSTTGAWVVSNQRSTVRDPETAFAPGLTVEGRVESGDA